MVERNNNTEQVHSELEASEARKKRLGEKVRDLRIHKGLTQSELSDGFATPSMISQIEHGKAFPSYGMLVCIAERLGVTYEYMITDIEDKLSQDIKYKSIKILMQQQGNKELVLELIDKYVEDTQVFDMNVTEVMMDKADCFLQLQRYEHARELLDDLLETEKARLEPNHYIIAQIYNLIGSSYLLQTNLLDACANYSIALNYASKIVEPDIVVGLINYNLGRTYEYKGDVEKAIFHYDTAKEILKAIDADPTRMANLYYAYALSYQKLGNLRVAEEYINKALVLYQTTNDFKMVNRVRESTAYLISAKRDTFTAVQELLSCIVTAKKLDDSTHVAYIYAKLINLLLDAQKFSDADIYFKEMKHYVVSGENLRVAFINRVIARYYLEVKNNYSHAIEYANNSSELFDRMGMKREAGLSLKYVIEAYESLGEKDNALIASKKVIQLIE